MTGLHVKLILYKVTYIYLSCNISLLTCNLAKGKKYISMFFASYQKFLDRPYDWFYSGFLSSCNSTNLGKTSTKTNHLQTEWQRMNLVHELND